LDTLCPVTFSDVDAACRPLYDIVNPKNVDAIFSSFPGGFITGQHPLPWLSAFAPVQITV
jgi:hypothetical protein